MKVIDISDLTARFSALAGSEEPVALAVDGQTVGIVLAPSAYEALQEQLVLRQDPERLSEILVTHQQVQDGSYTDGISLVELEEKLEEQRNRAQQGGDLEV